MDRSPEGYIRLSQGQYPNETSAIEFPSETRWPAFYYMHRSAGVLERLRCGRFSHGPQPRGENVHSARP